MRFETASKSKLKYLFTAAIIAAALFLPQKSQAACVAAAGQEAWPVFYTASSAVYCGNGTSWNTIATGGGTPAPSNGYIQFNDSNAFGGDANLFWDNTNKRLGIGTATPSYKLTVSGNGGTDSALINATGGVAYFGAVGNATDLALETSGTQRVHIAAGGNVGIGTVTPARRLVIAGDASAANGTYAGGVTLFDIQGNVGGFSEPKMVFTEAGNVIGSIAAKNSAGYAGALIFATNNTPYASAGDVERMRILANGNVGIGTTAPLTKLHIVGGDLTVENGNGGSAGDGGKILFRAGSISDTVGMAAIKGLITFGGEANGQSGHLAFYTNQRTSANTYTGLTERIRITDVGNVGIGTATPGSPLTLATGPGQFTAAFVVLPSTHATSRRAMLQLDEWGILQDLNGTGTKDFTIWQGSQNAARLYISTSGNVGIGGASSPAYTLQVNGTVAGASAYISTSDKRLKKDIEPLSYGLAEVRRLHPVTFQWKDQKPDWAKGRKLGLIAQEVEPIVPEVVSTAHDKIGTKSIAYGDLTPVLIHAIQELAADNDNLKSENSELRRSVKEIDARLNVLEVHDMNSGAR